MTKAQMQEKIDNMAKGIKKYRTEIKALKDEVALWSYRHDLAVKGRKFWRAEAKKHGTTYDYHVQKLREDGEFGKVYSRRT